MDAGIFSIIVLFFFCQSKEPLLGSKSSDAQKLSTTRYLKSELHSLNRSYIIISIKKTEYPLTFLALKSIMCSGYYFKLTVFHQLELAFDVIVISTVSVRKGSYLYSSKICSLQGPPWASSSENQFIPSLVRPKAFSPVMHYPNVRL